jgi:hypothetical protein
MISKETNSNHYIKSTMTPIIQGINTNTENVGKSTFFARTERQYWKRNCHYFKASRNIFRRYTSCLDAGHQHLKTPI